MLLCKRELLEDGPSWCGAAPWSPSICAALGAPEPRRCSDGAGELHNFIDTDNELFGPDKHSDERLASIAASAATMSLQVSTQTLLSFAFESLHKQTHVPSTLVSSCLMIQISHESMIPQSTAVLCYYCSSQIQTVCSSLCETPLKSTTSSLTKASESPECHCPSPSYHL